MAFVDGSHIFHDPQTSPAGRTRKGPRGADSWLAFAVMLPDGAKRLLVRQER